MKKGLFITFEGGEGSGKTTLIKSIKENLIEKKLDLIVTREPGSTPFGEQVRELVLMQLETKINSKAELCLFLASRAQHIKDVIKPALTDGKVVLCDRYNDSSIAYQGHARGLGIDEVIKFSSFIIEDCLPDLTLYLDIDPKTGLSRVQSKYDRIESENFSFHNKIREGFHIIAQKFPDRIKIIDASKSKDEVFENAMHYISKIIE